MKKLLFLVLFASSIIGKAQAISFDQAKNSRDPRIVATFIKANPDHPRVVELKQHLIELVNSGAQASAAPQSGYNSSASSYATKTSYSSGGSAMHKQRTVDLLNHLFNSDPSSKDAYVQITNNSKCNVEMKISGRRSYMLSIPPRKQNFILVDKGTYTFSSMICEARYQSVKDVSKDVMITLNK